MKIPNIPWNSIRFKLVLGVLLVTVPLITLLIYNNFYSMQVVHDQVALSNRNLISLYMGQIDSQLKDADRNLISLLSDFDLQLMNDPNTENEYQLAKHSVANKLASDVVLYKTVDAFFVYSKSRGDLLDVFNSTVPYAEREQVEQRLHQFLEGKPDLAENGGNRWIVWQIGQDYYTLRILQSDDLYIGAWVNAKTLLIPLHLIDLGKEGSALLVSEAGEMMVSTNPITDDQLDLTKDFSSYYRSGDKNNLLIVGEPSQIGDFSLVAVIPDQQILQNLPNLSRLILMISIASIGLVPISLYLLRRIVLVPLKRLIVVMKRINTGNVNVRVETYPASDEIQMVNRTFNTMMTQIEELKINVYEEQINKQRAELQHLQLQINPHFFMNSLNILYNLAQVKNYELIQELTICLVRYFRFMFQSNLKFVLLREELQHVRNYIRIQELRFPKALSCSIDTVDFLEPFPVPPLVIQSLLENSIKHGMTLDKPLHIAVSIDLKETGTEPYVEIIVRDTGKGFSEHALAEIRSGNKVIDEEGEHIGLWNVHRRLQLLYDDQASISCYNDLPHGAVVEIRIPYHSKYAEGGGHGHASAFNRR